MFKKIGNQSWPIRLIPCTCFCCLEHLYSSLKIWPSKNLIFRKVNYPSKICTDLHLNITYTDEPLPRPFPKIKESSRNHLRPKRCLKFGAFFENLWKPRHIYVMVVATLKKKIKWIPIPECWQIEPVLSFWGPFTVSSMQVAHSFSAFPPAQIPQRTYHTLRRIQWVTLSHWVEVCTGWNLVPKYFHGFLFTKHRLTSVLRPPKCSPINNDMPLPSRWFLKSQVESGETHRPVTSSGMYWIPQEFGAGAEDMVSQDLNSPQVFQRKKPCNFIRNATAKTTDSPIIRLFGFSRWFSISEKISIRLNILAGWWFSHPSEKYESQLGWLATQYMGK